MFCSGCGRTLETGVAVCPQCGRIVPQAFPAAPAVPPPAVPGLAYQLDRYAGTVRMLGILWFVYAGISIFFGFIGMAFVHSFFSGGFGPWMHGSEIPDWIFPAAIHFGWLLLSMRVILSVVAGWGLLERAQWGRIVAIVAAILNLIHPLLGTALGIATLVILLGSRNSMLYEQL